MDAQLTGPGDAGRSSRLPPTNGNLRMVTAHDACWVRALAQRMIPLLPARYDWRPVGNGVRAIRVIRGYKWIPNSHHGIGGISTLQFVCAASNRLMETGIPREPRYEPLSL